MVSTPAPARGSSPRSRLPSMLIASAFLMMGLTLGGCEPVSTATPLAVAEWTPGPSAFQGATPGSALASAAGVMNSATAAQPARQGLVTVVTLTPSAPGTPTPPAHSMPGTPAQPVPASGTVASSSPTGMPATAPHSAAGQPTGMPRRVL